MCRWLAHSGSPVVIEDLLRKPAHSALHVLSDDARLVVSEPGKEDIRPFAPVRP